MCVKMSTKYALIIKSGYGLYSLHVILWGISNIASCIFHPFFPQKQSAYRMHMPITSFATIEVQVTFKNNLIQGQNAV